MLSFSILSYIIIFVALLRKGVLPQNEEKQKTCHVTGLLFEFNERFFQMDASVEKYNCSFPSLSRL